VLTQYIEYKRLFRLAKVQVNGERDQILFVNFMVFI
jgi:hypothetical protein